MAIPILPDGSKLGGGGGGGQGAGADGGDASGTELALLVKDDDPQCPSSFNSSSSLGLISGMRNESSHFDDRFETRDLRNMLHRFEPAPTNIQGNNSVENRKKGLLSSFYTIAEKLLMSSATFVVLSLSYPLGANAKETFEDHRMQGIIIGNVISFLISFLLIAVTSYLKDSESIGGIGFHVFKWLVLVLFLFLYGGLCVIMRFCARTPKSILWTLGAVGYIIILSIWVWVFYVEVPQIREELKKAYETENRVPSGPDSVAASNTPGLPRRQVETRRAS